MKQQKTQNFFPVVNTLISKLGIETQTKAGEKMEKEIAKTLIGLSQDIDTIVKNRIKKEDKQIVKELKHQQKKQRKERRIAAVAELLKNYNYAV